MSQFVNLHNHSHFSLLDGLAKPDEYIPRAVELGQTAVALTDHGSLSGIYQLWKVGNEHGVKPIAGCEFYIAPSSRHTKESVFFGTEEQRRMDVSKNGAYGHLTVLAKDADGVRNLYRLQEAAYREGFYNKPRIDLELLHEHRDGLLCLTGCASSLLSVRLQLEQIPEAESHVGDLRDIFEDDLFVEVMYHGVKDDGLDEYLLDQKLFDISTRMGVPLVATNDAHYCHLEDATVHRALLCLQTNSKLDNPKFALGGSGYHLASYDEMERRLSEANIPSEALAATVAINERIESYDTIFEHRDRMPKWSDDSDADLRAAVTGGGYGDLSSTQQERLEYELDTITSLGYSDYFLILADIVHEARRRGIRVGPARGSASGSAVSYRLGITLLDPITNGLLFERFLNPERVSHPDIDIDIQEDRRGELLNWVREKYGEGCVAAVNTFGTVGARAALKDATRVLGYPYSVGEERVRQLPKATATGNPTVSDYTGPRDDIFDLAVGLEGTVRNEGIHAAAIIISPEPLVDCLPLRYPGGKESSVACFNMHEIEALGFQKIDLLGLRTLTIIDDVVKSLVDKGIEVELPTDTARCGDPKTFELLASGNTLGVFQLDSWGMRSLLTQVKPTVFEDIAATVSLYRPGPLGVGAHESYARRKNGREGTDYIHPELVGDVKDILDATHGLVVYQEQVLKVLAAVAGYTYSTAETIFDAMRKKKLDKLQAAKPELVSRMKGRGYSQAAIDALWDVLLPFAGYSFNKSHAAGYALLAYWTAYLKANYPREFMAALLSREPNNNKDSKRKFASYLEECDRMGIPILPPDVNESDARFTATQDGIRYGLADIKGVGGQAVAGIVRHRPFKSLTDFYNRAPNSALNIRALGPLVRSGALDALASREGHDEKFELHADRAKETRENRRQGQRGIVKVRYNVPKKPFNMKQRQKWERETLGVSLSVGDVVIGVKEPLPLPAMEWLKRVIKDHPGRQRTFLDFGVGKPFDTGCKINLDAARQLLQALGVVTSEDTPR